MMAFLNPAFSNDFCQSFTPELNKEPILRVLADLYNILLAWPVQQVRLFCFSRSAGFGSNLQRVITLTSFTPADRRRSL